MEIVSNIALISINETLIFQLVSFLVFMFVIDRLMVRPLRSVMDERENHVEKVRHDIADADAELERLTREIEAEESSVKKAAFEMKARLEEAGAREAADIFSVTRKEIGALREQNQKAVKAELADARRSVQAEAEALAVNIMEKILNRRLAA